MHPAFRLSTVLLGIGLIVGGSLLTIDFRGFTTRNAKREIEEMRWAERYLRHIQPWKTLFQQPMEH